MHSKGLFFVSQKKTSNKTYCGWNEERKMKTMVFSFKNHFEPWMHKSFFN